MTTVAEILEHSADRLEGGCWYSPPNLGILARDSYCIMTSITSRWRQPLAVRDEIYRHLYTAIYDLTGHSVNNRQMGIPFFNDNLAESKEQCVDILRYAAKLAREH